MVAFRALCGHYVKVALCAHDRAVINDWFNGNVFSFVAWQAAMICSLCLEAEQANVRAAEPTH